jgi:chorismate mutase/prephenate dehydratase
MPDNLKQLRARIDALDLEILKLVSERASAAHAIGKLKDDGTVYRPEREAQVLRRLTENNPGPLPDKVVMHLFTEVISACRALEDAFSVASLGPKGTFSEEAVVKHFGGQAPVVLCNSIDEVFRSVESGNVGYGMVPLENSTEGAVGRTLDLLLSSPLKICGEVLLPVHQNLLSKGSDISAIKRIFSHAQSLAQCNRWISHRCPRAECVPVASNAEAAKRAQDDPESAAIAGRAAAGHYGLSILAGNIEDEPNNTTRFVVISRQDVAPSGNDKTSLVMSARNVSGAMHELLTPLARNGVSMTRLESRPSRTGLWEYVFFLDMEGHQNEENVARALEEMRELAAFLKILGSYPVAVQ